MHIGGGTRGALGASAPTKFISAHRNLVSTLKTTFTV